jgi:hypothetical protein
VLESIKSQIPSTKLQINLKFQYSIVRPRGSRQVTKIKKIGLEFLRLQGSITPLFPIGQDFNDRGDNIGGDIGS